MQFHFQYSAFRSHLCRQFISCEACNDIHWLPSGMTCPSLLRILPSQTFPPFSSVEPEDDLFCTGFKPPPSPPDVLFMSMSLPPPRARPAPSAYASASSRPNSIPPPAPPLLLPSASESLRSIHPTTHSPNSNHISSPLQHQQHSRAIGSPTRCRRPRRPLQRPPMQRLPNLPRRDEANGQPRLRPRVLLYVYSEYAARPKQTLDLAPIFARESALHLLRSPITLPPSPGCLKEQGKQGNCPICRYVPNQNHITQPQTPISPSCAERKPRCEKFDACSCLKDHPSGLFPAETTHSSLVLI